MKNVKALVVGWLALSIALPVCAQEPTVQELMNEIQSLRKRVDELEKAQGAKQGKEAQAAESKLVQSKNRSKIQIDGRAFLSTVKAQQGGVNSVNAGTFAVQIPDSRLRFTYSPSNDMEVTTRLRLGLDGMLNTPAAGGQLVDYLYADIKNRIRGANTTFRIGRIKTDLGEETWMDNPVENLMNNTSIGMIGGYTEGLQVFGTTQGASPLRYSAGIINDQTGSGLSNGTGLFLKLSGEPDTKKRVHLSGSYYRSDSLPAKNPATPAPFAAAIAFGSGNNMNTSPDGALAGATWKRHAWELDATYNYANGSPPFAGYGAKGLYGGRIAYGRIANDSETTAKNRDGYYYHIEGLYNLAPQAYLMGRYSSLVLDSGAAGFAAPTLSVAPGNPGAPLAFNRINRLQLGLGYRLSPLTALKFEYLRDRETPVETPNDTVSLGVATKF